MQYRSHACTLDICSAVSIVNHLSKIICNAYFQLCFESLAKFRLILCPLRLKKILHTIACQTIPKSACHCSPAFCFVRKSNASSLEGRGVGAMLRAILRGSSSDRVNLWVIDPGMVCLFLKMLTSNSGTYAYALGSYCIGDDTY